MKNLVPMIVTGLCALALLAGCAPKPLPRMLWPVPPSEPKIELLNVYYSQNSFPKTGLQRFFEAVLGTPAPAGLRTPFDIVVDSRGVVYVSDMHAVNLRIFDLNNYTVEFYSKEPLFTQPRGLAIDDRDNLYIVEQKEAVIKVFTPDRRLLRHFGKGVLKRPVAVALNQRLGRIYVSDTKGNFVAIFDMEGNHLSSFGKPGDAHGEFGAPMGMAIDRDNNLYVADALGARIQVFTADGGYLRGFGERGDQERNFEMPRDLAFDSDGNLWIVDGRRGHMLTYKPTGEFLLATGQATKTIAGFGFGGASGIFIDAHDRIYVADTPNRRFSVWQYLNKAYLAAHPISETDLQKSTELVGGAVKPPTAAP